MQMTRDLKDRCMECTNKFLKWDLMDDFKSKIEKLPLDPEVIRTYLQIIKEPMCLLQVRDKLRENRYKTLDEYKYDMNLIWSNAIQFNGETSSIGVLAECGRQKFNRKIAKLELSPVESYLRKLVKVSRQLESLSSAFKKEIDHMPSSVLYSDQK